jgi:hypothetical protein
MSGMVHRNRTACRAGVAAAGVVLLLAGCGSGDSRSGAAGTPAAETTAPPGDADFCDQAAALDDRVDSAVSDLGNDASIPDALRELTVELRAIEAPAPIAADWETLAGGLERMTDAITDGDITDPTTLDALDAAERDLSGAGDRIDTYLREECGISN